MGLLAYSTSILLHKSGRVNHSSNLLITYMTKVVEAKLNTHPVGHLHKRLLGDQEVI